MQGKSLKRWGSGALVALTIASVSALAPAMASAKAAPKAAAVTKTEVNSLIKAYLKAHPVKGATGAQGAAGAQGATGLTGATGAMGSPGAMGASGTPAPLYTAGTGLVLSGNAFSLNPSSTIFQDPLTSTCGPYQFLSAISQTGVPTCNFGTIADVKNVAPKIQPSIGTAETTIASVGVGSADYLVSASATLTNSGSSPAQVQCQISDGSTAYANGEVTVPANGDAMVSESAANGFASGNALLQCATSATTVMAMQSENVPTVSISAVALNTNSSLAYSSTT